MSMMMQVVQGNMQAMARSAASMEKMAAAIEQSAAISAAPKRVLKDDMGQVIGVAPDPSMMQ